MDRKNALSLAALTLLAGAITAGNAMPAGAAKAPTVPPPPAEAGCYDLVSGRPSFQRHVLSITQNERVPATPLAPALYDEAVVEESDRGTVTGNIGLGAPSCTDATYVLEVYASEPSADGSYSLLARTALPGDGLRTTLFLDTAIRSYTGMAVRVTGSVRDSYGRVIDESDISLSSGDALVTALDDALPTPGGGQQFWG
jgi:hypothetical protein